MGKIVGYATVGMVLALAKKMAIQYGALGIADVRTTPDGSDLIFIMSDGSQHRVELNFSANGVDYDDSVTKFNVSNVQAAIEALFSELQAKQNTLTAGNGISIENDTIAVTDAGGLTVLKESDFPLSADLLAKVNANPQNYCYVNGDYVYYYKDKNSKLGGDIPLYTYITDTWRRSEYGYGRASIGIREDTGEKWVTDDAYHNTELEFSNTMKLVSGLRGYSVVGVRAETKNQTITGDNIHSAITIRKWH